MSEYTFPVDIITTNNAFTVKLKNNFITSSTCKKCWAKIYWAETHKWKKMPIVRKYIPSFWQWEIYSHYEDCTHANKFRKSN